MYDLTTEYERIFTSHFGKKPYFAQLVHALAEYPLGLCRENLARSVGTGQNLLADSRRP